MGVDGGGGIADVVMLVILVMVFKAEQVQAACGSEGVLLVCRP